MEPVIVAPCGDYSPENCRAAIARVVAGTPALRDIRPGTRVCIKVNLITRMAPERAATTHPALVEALCRYLRGAGAEAVIGDSPGGPFTRAYLDAVYSGSGLRAAAERSGAALNQDFSVRHAVFPEGAVLRDFDYTGWLDSGDLIVNFCKLKSHGMMGLSCAVKNLFGAIPGLTKPAYHYRFPSYPDFADMLIDLNRYFRPAVHIVDAVVAMEGNGPTAGTPRPMGAVFASGDPFGLDLVCAGLVGMGPEQIPTLEAARRRGLAPASAAEVPLQGEAAPFAIPDFDIAPPEISLERFAGGTGPLAGAANRFFRNVMALRPRLKAGACVKCGKCAQLCPANAITLGRRGPAIDRRACIRCFCCQEMCPVGALHARRSAFGDLALRLTQKQ